MAAVIILSWNEQLFLGGKLVSEESFILMLGTEFPGVHLLEWARIKSIGCLDRQLGEPLRHLAFRMMFKSRGEAACLPALRLF